MITLDEWQAKTGTVRFVPPEIEAGLSEDARRLVLGEAWALSDIFGVPVVTVYRDRLGTLCFKHASEA